MKEVHRIFQVLLKCSMEGGWICLARLSPQCPTSPAGQNSWCYVWSGERDHHLRYHSFSSSCRRKPIISSLIYLPKAPKKSSNS